jgi:hypothetical protein
MEKSALKNTTNIVIISDYLNEQAIKSSVEDQETVTKLISNETNTRDDLHIVVIAAVVNTVLRGSAIANQTIKIVRNLRKKNRIVKPRGTIIVETPNTKTEISFNLSEEDFKQKLQDLSKLSEIPQIFITKHND